jgi:multisubunit Na+/H+ antiporter MnhE subunit
MIAGVIVATVVTFFCSRLLTARLEPGDDWPFMEAFIVMWAALCAALAYVVGRLAPRAQPNP